jgi:RHS repeat-associated protein
MAPGWRVGVAATTGGIFVLVISIPVPLLGPSRASAVSPASVVYYHGDHLASSVVATGEVPLPGLLRHVVYRPYGGVVAEAAGGSTEPPEVGFTGQRFEEDAGIYHYGARWYDPGLGRFLQPDAIVPEGIGKAAFPARPIMRRSVNFPSGMALGGSARLRIRSPG